MKRAGRRDRGVSTSTAHQGSEITVKRVGRVQPMHRQVLLLAAAQALVQTASTLFPNQLEFGPLALTRAMCPPGSLHDQIAKNWTYIRSYVIKNSHLFLSLMADGGVYEFEAVASTAFLTGKKWRLIEVNGITVKTGKPYIEFDAKTRRYAGDSRCNRIAGGYEVDGTHIKFSQGISTKRACLDNEMQKLETDFVKGLSEVTNFQIQGEVLRLYKGEQPLLMFTGIAGN
jgi:heat shock protein HslJ